MRGVLGVDAALARRLGLEVHHELGLELEQRGERARTEHLGDERLELGVLLRNLGLVLRLGDRLDRRRGLRGGRRRAARERDRRRARARRRGERTRQRAMRGGGRRAGGVLARAWRRARLRERASEAGAPLASRSRSRRRWAEEHRPARAWPARAQPARRAADGCAREAVCAGAGCTDKHKGRRLVNAAQKRQGRGSCMRARARAAGSGAPRRSRVWRRARPGRPWPRPARPMSPWPRRARRLPSGRLPPWRRWPPRRRGGSHW